MFPLYPESVGRTTPMTWTCRRCSTRGSTTRWRTSSHTGTRASHPSSQVDNLINFYKKRILSLSLQVVILFHGGTCNTTGNLDFFTYIFEKWVWLRLELGLQHAEGLSSRHRILTVPVKRVALVRPFFSSSDLDSPC